MRECTAVGATDIWNPTIFVLMKIMLIFRTEKIYNLRKKWSILFRLTALPQQTDCWYMDKWNHSPLIVIVDDTIITVI